jgi:hypothetical protein
MNTRAIYPIGVVAELAELHPETLRVWERSGLVKPKRRNGHRLYSEADVTRVTFVKGLLDRGLNLAGVRAIVELYPCFWIPDCPKCSNTTERQGCAKPCWKEAGTYCRVCFTDPAMCRNCANVKEGDTCELAF